MTLIEAVNSTIGLEMPGLGGLERARRPEHRSAVLSRHDVFAVLDKRIGNSKLTVAEQAIYLVAGKGPNPCPPIIRVTQWQAGKLLQSTRVPDSQ